MQFSHVKTFHVSDLEPLEIALVELRLKKLVWEWREDMPNVGVLCIWYSVEKEKGFLTEKIKEMVVHSHGFHPCKENYICSVPAAFYDNSKLEFSQDTIENIRLYVKDLL